VCAKLTLVPGHPPVSPSTAGPAVQVTLDPGVTVVIGRRADGGKCEVCTEEDGARCSATEVSLSKAQTVRFGCPRPQEVFDVRLQRNIGKGASRLTHRAVAMFHSGCHVGSHVR